MDNNNEVIVDNQVLNLIKLRVLKLERDNVRTNAKDNDGMIKAIMKIIEEETKCL